MSLRYEIKELSRKITGYPAVLEKIKPYSLALVVGPDDGPNAPLRFVETVDQAPVSGPFTLTLKDIRRKAGLSRRELASAISVSPRTVENWEQGRRRPAGDIVLRLVCFFNLRVLVLSPQNATVILAEITPHPGLE